MSTAVASVQSWRAFDVEVRRVKRFSTSFLRVTFAGEDLDRFADSGFDLRVKLILPAPVGGLSNLPTGKNWFSQLRTLPSMQQCPVRTYTARAVRQDAREVDIDLVMHAGHGLGPAAKWAMFASVGDKAVLWGPNRDYDGSHGGVDFRPPASMSRLLLAGDETAVPAICAILEHLPTAHETRVVMEVPHHTDVMAIENDLPSLPGNVRIDLLPRDGADHGAKMVVAVRETTANLLGQAAHRVELEDIDVDNTLLWEVPGEAAQASQGLYAWLAGEAAVIKTLRRHLVSDCGLDRKAVAFMGYWRQGRPERT